jgi:hypothetical protein
MIKPKSGSKPQTKGRIPAAPKLVMDTQSDNSPFVRALVVGASKSGKTLFHSTFPKPLILDCGKTLATLTARGLKIPTISFVPETERSPEGELNSYLHVREALLDILQRGGRFWDQLPYVPETVVIDHLNGLCTLMEAEIVLHPPYANRAKGPQLEKSDYNIIQRRLYIEILMLGFDLPMHFICVSELKNDNAYEKSTGGVRMIPALTGNALSATIPGQFNNVFLTYIEYDDEGEGKRRQKTHPHYYLSAIPEREIPYLGVRGIRLPEPIENPTFDKIIKKGR